MSVKYCHIIRSGNSVYTHLASAVTFWLILLYDICPKHTSCTELSNLHEVVLRNTHIELYLLCCKSWFYASINELLKIFVTPRESITEFLNDISATIAKSNRIDCNTTEVRIILESFYKSRSNSKKFLDILALHYHFLDWIPINGTYNFLLIIFLLFEICSKDFSKFQTVTLASGEVYFYYIAIDTFEQLLYELCTHLVTRYTE